MLRQYEQSLKQDEKLGNTGWTNRRQKRLADTEVPYKFLLVTEKK